MNDGWTKLYRKTLNNEVFFRDPTAWRVFEYLMLVVDSKSGTRSCGRFQIARELKMKDTTVYSALKRLEKTKMINILSNNQFSDISITNWHSYQHTDNNLVNTKSTMARHQDNTKQEIRIEKREEIVKEKNPDPNYRRNLALEEFERTKKKLIDLKSMQNTP